MKEEWKEEEDYFNFNYDGYECIGVRQRLMKYWMGYVIIPSNHPWFGLHEAQFINVPVHQGVNYADRNPFIPEEEAEQLPEWWVGFYCGKAFDLIPYFWEQEGKEYPRLFKFHVYRNEEYVKGELRKLAHFARLAKLAHERNQ